MPARGDLAGAIRHFDQALRLQPDYFWARYYLAACQLSAGRPDLAEALLTACLGSATPTPLGLPAAGIRPRKIGRLGWRRGRLPKGRASNPNADARYALLVNRGAIRLEQGKFAEAASDFEQARR